MTVPPLTIPPPLPDDHEDVAWALRAASAQWRRSAQADAVSWVRRAAETALEVGQMRRGLELSALADYLARAPQQSAPPPPLRQSALPPQSAPPPPIPRPQPASLAPRPLPASARALAPQAAVAPPAPSRAAAPIAAARPALPSLEIRFDEGGVLGDDAVDELLEDDILLEDEPESSVVGVASPTSGRNFSNMGPTSRVALARSGAEAMARSSSPELLVDEVSLDDLGLDGLDELTEDVDEDMIELLDELDEPEDTEASEPEAARLDELESATDTAAQGPVLDELETPSRAPEGADAEFDESEAPTSVASPIPSSSSNFEDELSEYPTDPEDRSLALASTPPPTPTPVSSSIPPSASSRSSASPVSFRISARPVEPFPMAPSAQLPEVRSSSLPPPSAIERIESVVPPLADPVVDGVSLLDVSGLQDLPEEAQIELTTLAKLCDLGVGEEVSSFGVALVTRGSVEIMPAVADASCALAQRGKVIFTRGSLEESVVLRVVGAAPGTRVAVWSSKELESATEECPWVADELALVADRYQALAGAVMGPLGDSLDAMFRGMVLDKCTVRRFGAGEVIIVGGKAVDGMYIVGAGRVELVDDAGKPVGELGPGDFAFPSTILAAGTASATARAGQHGALLLYASRMDAHELLATCPPFIELLAG